MTSSSEVTPLDRKKQRLVLIRIGGVAAVFCAVALLWNDPATLGAVAGAIMLLSVLGFYLVEVQYAKALERALAKTGE